MFSDVKICCKNNKFASTVCRKPAFSGVFTNHESFISTYRKRELLYTLLRKSCCDFDWSGLKDIKNQRNESSLEVEILYQYQCRFKINHSFDTNFTFLNKFSQIWKKKNSWEIYHYILYIFRKPSISHVIWNTDKIDFHGIFQTCNNFNPFSRIGNRKCLLMVPTLQ